MSTGVSASALPSISRLLAVPTVAAAVERHGRQVVADALRAAVERARADALAGRPVPGHDRLAAQALAVLADHRRGRTRRVVNATGVVLHTNLGRAPLSPRARAAMDAATGYANLEYDLATGARGGRGRFAADLLARCCDAEAATVVNNGAAALVLALAALAGDRATLVSRGQLIEIGGSFRLPEIMATSGTRLVEVGTTNRTRAADYTAAVDHDTALVLAVHPSNYRIVGFTAQPSTAELAELAHAAGLALLVDVGSGLLDDHDTALAGEPIPAAALQAGADLVVFSGDKLLGGPQAGVIAGRPDLVERCRRHPLARALRVDKFRLAALEATLEDHLAGTPPPARTMLAADLDDLRARADALAARIDGEVVQVASVAGGGSLPQTELASAAVALDGPADLVLATLRGGDPPIIGRIVDDRAVLDVRTLDAADEDAIAAAVAALHRTADADPVPDPGSGASGAPPAS